MRGSFYVIAEILVFLLAAAVIGYLIGRLTSRGDRAEPLKRLAEVDANPAKSEVTSAGQAADLRRRLGIAYQTIRELEESNMKLREAAAGSQVSETEDSEDGESEEPAGDAVGDAASATEPEAASGDDASDVVDAAEGSDQAVGDHQAPDEPEAADDEAEASADDAQTDAGDALGPAERIRAAKEARDAAAASAAASAPAAAHAAEELAAKDAEIARLKADLDRQMQQMGSLADRISELEG